VTKPSTDQAPDKDEVSQAFLDRQADLVLTPATPDITTSPEVAQILREQGVEAAQEWIAAQHGQ
jgi:hypothetical protein